MAKQATEREISKGVCHFCQGEFAKNKITQHLKACKTRSAIVAERNGPARHLLHLQVEGTYRPSYWMHLEMPSEATLADLDSFLRAVWLECCGHLSEFTIKDVSYSSAMGDGWGDEMLLLEGEEEGLPDVGQIATQISQGLSSELGADLKDVSVDEIEKKLEQMFAENLPAGLTISTLPTLKPLLGYMASALQQGTLAEELEEFEEAEPGETDMSVELGKVLKVGDKFSYVYDFGSSTTLSLRVIAEREGAMLTPVDARSEVETEEDIPADEDEQVSVVVMAHNEPPAFACSLCGKPATYIASLEEFGSVEEAVLCESCAQKQEYPDELLPLVNSPRAGVCGYTGEYEGEDEYEEEDDEGEEE